MAPTLFLIRHAETAANADARIRAWTNPSISEEGIPVVKETANLLARFPLKGIVTSDLRRCRQTAWVIANECFLEIVDDFGLRPWNLGQYGGRKVDEVKEELQRLRLHPSEKPPDGEPYRDYLNRFRRTWKRLQRAALADPEEHLVIVTHARNIGLTHFFERGDQAALDEIETPLAPGEGTSWRHNGTIWTEVPVSRRARHAS